MRRSRSPVIAFDVLAVPGHSPAHVAYYADGCLLSGDVLFAGSVGRTDIPGRRLGHPARLDPHAHEHLADDTVVYPGHGPITTLGEELARNPFLNDLRAERTA